MGDKANKKERKRKKITIEGKDKRKICEKGRGEKIFKGNRERENKNKRKEN